MKLYLWVSVLSSSSLIFTENLDILGLTGGMKKNGLEKAFLASKLVKKVIILNKIMIEAKARLTWHF